MSRTYNEHTNDIGDWCPWSGRAVWPTEDNEDDEDPCPAGCQDSHPEDEEEG